MLGQHFCFLITERGISFKGFAVPMSCLLFAFKMFTRLNKYTNNFNRMSVFLLRFLNFQLPVSTI